jgi:MFS family permease
VSTAGSALCAAAPNSSAFITGRAIAGVGAAGLFQGALTIVGLTVPLEKRPLYLGLIVSVFGIALAFGPPLGGVLTDHVTWRWCFWINLPIGAVVSALIIFFLKLRDTGNEDRKLPLKTKLRSLDFLGATLIFGAFTCLLLAIQWGGTTYAWKSSQIIGLFIGLGLLLIAFIGLQWRLGDNATIPYRILGQRSVLTGSIFICCSQGTSMVVGYSFISFTKVA